MALDAVRSLIVVPEGPSTGELEGEDTLCERVETLLRARGHEVTVTLGADEAPAAMRAEPFDLAFVIWEPAGAAAGAARRLASWASPDARDDASGDATDDASGEASAEIVAVHAHLEPGPDDLVAMRLSGVGELLSLPGGADNVLGFRLELLERRLRARRRRRAQSRIATQALRESDERFRLVAKATSDALYDWDLETNAIVWSEGVCELFGYAPEEVPLDLGWWQARLHPGDRASVEADLRAAIEERREIWTHEYRFRAADGSYVPVSDRGVVLRDDQGKGLRMIGAMSDLTERKAMEGRLQLADRMASIGTLAAGMAHEINNPLTYVLSNVDLAAARLDGAEWPGASGAREALAAAREGAERVRRIVRSLKTFARAEDGRRGPVDVVRTLEACIQMAKSQLDGRAEIERDYAEGLPAADADEPRLAQVFLNLLVNVAQALPAAPSARSRIAVGARSEGARVRVWVEDDGVGIPEEVRNRIFDPFYTSKPVGEGTGLGLSICHAIVTSLGGEILVESEEGRGSRFSVLLPASGAEAASPRPRPSPPPPSAAGPRRRVLVVDDDVRVARVIAQTLEPFHEAEAMTDGRAALARLAAGERFDVILCDLMMPGVTGMDLHEGLAAAAPELLPRVVFLTGGAFTPRARDFLETVPNLRLEKPFDTDALLSVVRRAAEMP